MLKLIEGYWTDENGNQWSANKYAEGEATILSKTLENCRYCINCYCCHGCSDCGNCTDCSYCSSCRYCSRCISCCDCINCRNCTDCYYCRYCRDCTDCHDCRYCSRGSHCSYCSDCRGCSHCSYCRYCRDYKNNPLQYTTKKIGSRNESTNFYYDGDSNIQVVCGCFRGNLDQFEQAVLKTHANNEKYKNQYLKEIEKVKVLFELNK